MAASEQERAAIIRLLADTPKPVIVDVGAYIGDEYDWMKNAFPGMNYVGVEADPRNVAHFRERYPQANVIHGAIANTTGPIEFHQCDNNAGQGIGSGSIRAPKKHLEFFPWCRFDNTITVEGYTLSTLCLAVLSNDGVISLDAKIDLLWVDIQGAERDMIAGGAWALSRTRFMMIEAEEHEFYEGQATKSELLALLPEWEVVEDFGFNVLLARKGL